MEFPILFEDASFLAINKPPGVVVNRAESVKGETVQDWVESYWKSQITNPNVKNTIDEAHWSLSFGHCDFCSRAGIVHRIDKETSGILLIAKTPQAFIELQRQFKERLIKKTYLAVVHGVVVPTSGEIRAPVGRLPWNRERFGVVPGGKEAVTRYRVKGQETKDKRQEAGEPYRVNKGQEVSVVELFPETGRTHQIRVHLKYINHPIVGDYVYAGRKTGRDDREDGTRVLLHAWKLVCIHPVTEEPLAIEAPIPDDIQRYAV